MNQRLVKVITLPILLTFFGCSGKNITLQDYADTWFNNKEKKEVPKSTLDSTSKKSQNHKRETAKKNPAADIAWSSTAKRDVHNKGQGSMQKSLDKWTKEEWDPTFEGDAGQAKKDENASKHFTLQHYMDKREKYLDKDKEKWEKSGKKKPEANYKKMEKMPVIGK